MNNELININQSNFNGQVKQTVNARDLHSNLESKRQFADWVKDRLEDFIENQDFIIVSQIYETKTSEGLARGSRVNDYHLTLETAKHIAMMERNEKGKQIRSYFIKVEETLKHNSIAQPLSLEDMLIEAGNRLKLEKQARLEAEREIQHKQIIIQTQHQKIKLFDEFKEASGNVCLQTGAKELHLKPNLFIKRLKDKSYLTSKDNLPKQSYINMGLFVVKTFTTNDGIESKQRRQTLLTPKGFHYFAHKVLEEFSDIMNEPDRMKYAGSMIHVNTNQSTNIARV